MVETYKVASFVNLIILPFGRSIMVVMVFMGTRYGGGVVHQLKVIYHGSFDVFYRNLLITYFMYFQYFIGVSSCSISCSYVAFIGSVLLTRSPFSRVLSFPFDKCLCWAIHLSSKQINFLNLQLEAITKRMKNKQ